MMSCSPFIMGYTFKSRIFPLVLKRRGLYTAMKTGLIEMRSPFNPGREQKLT